MLESLMLLQIDCTSSGIEDVFRDSMNVVWLFIGLLIGNNLDYLRIDKEDNEFWQPNCTEKQMYSYLYRLYPVIVMLCAVGYCLFIASNILLQDVYAGLGITITDKVKTIGLDTTGILISSSVDSFVSVIIPAAVFWCLFRVYLDNLYYLQVKCYEIVHFVVFTILCIICTVTLIVSGSDFVFFVLGIIAVILYLCIYINYSSETERGIGNMLKHFKNLFVCVESTVRNLWRKLKNLFNKKDNKEEHAEINDSIGE